MHTNKTNKKKKKKKRIKANSKIHYNWNLARES